MRALQFLLDFLKQFPPPRIGHNHLHAAVVDQLIALRYVFIRATRNRVGQFLVVARIPEQTAIVFGDVRRIVDIDLPVLQHFLHAHGPLAIGGAGIEPARRFGNENDHETFFSQAAIAVAAPRGLNDRLQRRQRAIHPRKIQVDACFDALCGDHAAGKARAKPFPNAIDLRAAVFGAQVRREKEGLLLRAKLLEPPKQAFRVLAQIDDAANAIQLRHFFGNRF